MILRLLGFIDLCAALLLLGMAFSLTIPVSLLLFFGGILFAKGLFIFGGDLLSVVDLIASVTFLLALFFTPWVFLLWILALFLMSKGVASFF